MYRQLRGSIPLLVRITLGLTYVSNMAACGYMYFSSGPSRGTLCDPRKEPLFLTDAARIIQMPNHLFSYFSRHFKRFSQPAFRKAALGQAVCIAALCCGVSYAAAAEFGEHHHHEEASDSAISPGQNASVENLPLANGGFQRVLYLPATGKMRGVMVMFPGGSGEIGIEKDAEIKHGDNFVVRTRALWQAKGFGVILVDALDHQSMRGVRSTEAYADVTRKILAFARERAGVPVWVLGTSQGSIAAMNAAAHAGQGEIAGVILTESVSVLGGSHETVFDAHPDKVRSAALVVANEDDRCDVAPPSKAPEIAHSMRQTHAEVLVVRGGVKRSHKDCGSLTPHGYYGIEESVVGSIVSWMDRS
jgi:pimeloyl-ACP methyl ester carboxylesterase